MTAQVVTDPIERLLLLSDDTIPEGTVVKIDVERLSCGCVNVDLRVRACGHEKVEQFLLNIDKGCLEGR
jgi:hypothetical protein